MEPGYEGFPAWSPDGNTLAYLREVDGMLQVFTRTLNASTPAQITRSPRDCREPFWSPDGTHIYYLSQAAGEESLWRVSAAGGTPKVALRNVMHLYRADTEAATVEPLTATDGSETTPSVSPDGRRIAYTSQEEEYHLIEVPLDGSRYTSVLSGSRMETDPAWSPLGNQYAYVSGRSGRPEIWLRSRDGSFEKPLVTSASFQDGATYMLAEIAFSPDGQRLAYQRREAGLFSLWVSTIAGGPPVRLGRAPGTTYVDFPTWSPDGEWVAFTYMTQGKWGLARVRAGGGDEVVVIKENIVYPSSPRWSPRGDWITCDMPEGFALVSPDGKKTRLLTEETWLAHGWSQDGRTLYAVRPTENLRFSSRGSSRAPVAGHLGRVDPHGAIRRPADQVLALAQPDLVGTPQQAAGEGRAREGAWDARARLGTGLAAERVAHAVDVAHEPRGPRLVAERVPDFGDEPGEARPRDMAVGPEPVTEVDVAEDARTAPE